MTLVVATRCAALYRGASHLLTVEIVEIKYFLVTSTRNTDDVIMHPASSLCQDVLKLIFIDIYRPPPSL